MFHFYFIFLLLLVPLEVVEDTGSCIVGVAELERRGDGILGRKNSLKAMCHSHNREGNCNLLFFFYFHCHSLTIFITSSFDVLV
ncbi:hypothetical protein AAZV13_14G100100 [Glycine max]